MARLLVEIDEGLKRELKIRLLREGKTLKAWLSEAAAAFVATPLTAARSRPSERALPARATDGDGPKPAKRFDDYLD